MIGPLMIAFVFSFVGSMPPGSINLSVMQLAMEDKKWAAIWFGLAASLVEFVYAGLAIRFQIFLTENIGVTHWFKVASGTMLIVLGLINFFKKPVKRERKLVGEKRGAFVKGLIVAATNPMAIPFWLAVTAYLEGLNWITLTDNNYLFYVAGISLGTFALLAVVANLGCRFSALSVNPWVIYKIPGIAFVIMGCWIFIQP